MTYHNPYSYEQELRDQVAERLDAIHRIYRADAFERGRPHMLANLVGSLGRLLLRLGARLGQPGRRLGQVAGHSAEQRG